VKLAVPRWGWSSPWNASPPPHVDTIYRPMLLITPRERQALGLLAQEKTDELAACLGVQAADLEPCLANLFSKMGAAGQSEAIDRAVQRGLIDPAMPVGAAD
jgi:DNA-binding CsgD family transcriptional regulator